MKSQNYKNHAMYYAPHHFIFYPVLLVLTGLSTWLTFTETENQLVFLFLTAGLLMLGFLSLMLRQHYALGNQDRIIRLEMRLRYFELTQKRFALLESKLSFAQLAALRFASDEELPALIDRTISENLSSTAIKKSIENWMPDYMRV